MPETVQLKPRLLLGVQTVGLKEDVIEMIVSLLDSVVLQVTSLNHQNQLQIQEAHQAWEKLAFHHQRLESVQVHTFLRQPLAGLPQLPEVLAADSRNPVQCCGACVPLCVAPRDAAIHLPFYRYFWLCLMCKSQLVFLNSLPPFSLSPSSLYSTLSPLLSTCFSLSVFFLLLINSPSPHGTHRLYRGREKANV